MKKQTWIRLAIAAVVLAAVALYGYQRWGGSNAASRRDVLALMPPDASAIFFVDFDALRNAPFVSELYAWAPKPQTDPEYAQFVKETGFDYERDLDHLAVAVGKRGRESDFFAVVDGRFDHAKLLAYATKNGAVTKSGTREVLSVPVSGSPKKISFSFLESDRIALTDDADLTSHLKVSPSNPDAAEWRSRFERLAGSPVFAVIRQDAAAGEALASRAPGGLRSPQLSSLLDQLLWITLAGKPENDGLRVVAEGESSADTTARQLVDLLNGIVILAEVGLNDAKTRQQVDPATREAYLELLKSVDASRIDRGDTKSVRLVFEITPKFLEAARSAPPPASAPAPAPAKPLPGKRAASKKGRT
jgi:hypothetical protein